VQIDPDVRFAIIGDGIELSNVRSIALASGILDKTFFTLGRLPKNCLPGWLHAANLVVGPLTLYPFVRQFSAPNKLFDAFACSRPVLMTFEGWMHDVARGAILVVSQDDMSTAARKVAEFLANGDEQRRARQAAQEIAKQLYDRQSIVTQLEKVLVCAVNE
jgi:glycosyltransferase involved in cell wall biosynthesis